MSNCSPTKNRMSNPTFVARKGKQGWTVALSHELGEMPVGPRLAKGTRFPREIGLSFKTKQETDEAADRWTEWYKSQPYVKKGMQKKIKYVA